MEYSFSQILLREVDSVHRLAHRLCQIVHEAEDLVQETYLRALKTAETYKPGEYGVRPWLFKILHNVLYTRRTRDYGVAVLFGSDCKSRRSRPSRLPFAPASTHPRDTAPSGQFDE